MTRKRFVKLVMADGGSRNHANQLAAWIRSIPAPYIHPNRLIVDVESYE